MRRQFVRVPRADGVGSERRRRFWKGSPISRRFEATRGVSSVVSERASQTLSVKGPKEGKTIASRLTGVNEIRIRDDRPQSTR